MAFATGKYAKGRCGRCGDKVSYADLMSDGQTKGLRVCGPCYDIKHPTEKPFKADDAQTLKFPAPDTDDDSPGDTGTSLVTAMGFTSYFGGNT